MAEVTTTEADQLEQLLASEEAAQAKQARQRVDQERREANGRKRASERLGDLMARVAGFANKPPAPPKPESPALKAERVRAQVVEREWLWRNSGVTARYHRVDLRALPPALPRDYHRMARELLSLLSHPRLIAIGGEPGTGKTALAAGLVRAWCNTNRRALYTRAQRYLSDLADAPFGEGAKGRVRARYVGVDLLVLDEVQSTNIGQTWVDELEQLIDERYGWKRATLLIGNLEKEAFRDRLGPRVWRRLVEEGGFYGTKWGPVHSLLTAAGVGESR